MDKQQEADLEKVPRGMVTDSTGTGSGSEQPGDAEPGWEIEDEGEDMPIT